MKQLLVFLFLLCAVGVSAQDVIVKKDGSTIVCRVVELTSTEITYKKWSDLNGFNYVMNRSDASSINYENGKKVSLSEVDNLYQPGNQNDGVQQYNDRALLRLDSEANKYINRAKTLKVIGWIGGIALSGFSLLPFSGEDSGSLGGELGGSLFLVGGIAWTTTFLLMANHQKKKAQMLDSSSIIQYDLKLSGGSSPSLGADLLSAHTVRKNTLGLGLRYNF